MARTRVIDGELDPEKVREAEELAQLNEDEGGEVFRAIDDLRGTQGTTVVIVKLSPEAEAGHVDTIPVAEFTIENMKERYGAGLYKVRVRGPKGWIPGGGNVKISTVGIKKPAKESTNDLSSILEVLDRRNAEKNEKFSKILELTIPGALAIVAAAIGRSSGPDIASLVTALKPAPGPSLTDLTTALAGMKTLSGGDAPKTDPIDTILRVMESVKGLTGDSTEKGESNWMDVVRDLVKEAVPAVRPILDNLAQAQAERARQLAVQPGLPMVSSPVVPRAAIPVVAAATLVSTDASVGNGSAGVAAANGSDDMMNFVMPMIKSNVAKILSWAEKDRNPTVYAEVFMDELPDIVANYLTPQDSLAYLQRVDWFERVVEFDSRLKPYQNWCDEFRQELVELIGEQLDEIVETQQTPGQITDPVNGELTE